MFFRNPEAAFANIRGALKRGGRLGFVCWRPLAENPWVTLPRDVALRHMEAPEPPAPGEPGPFGLADAARIRALLDSAGFSEIAVEPHDTTVRHAGDIAAVARSLSEFGPASRLIQEADEATRAAIVADLEKAVAPLHDGSGLDLAAAAWLVAAQA
jgi:SAM-dependent methyltransferase